MVPPCPPREDGALPRMASSEMSSAPSGTIPPGLPGSQGSFRATPLPGALIQASVVTRLECQGFFFLKKCQLPLPAPSVSPAWVLVPSLPPACHRIWESLPQAMPQFLHLNSTL